MGIGVVMMTVYCSAHHRVVVPRVLFAQKLMARKQLKKLSYWGVGEGEIFVLSIQVTGYWNFVKF